MLKQNPNFNLRTLDTQHNLKVDEFRTRQQVLKDKEDELSDITAKINEGNKHGLSNMSDEEANAFLFLLDKKTEIEKEIKLQKEALDEVEYYVDTADIMFKYYDIVENGNDENDNVPLNVENSILKFFTQPPTQHSLSNKEETHVNEDDRAALLDKYMQCTDGNYFRSVNNENSDCCPNCESKNRTLMINDGLMYCNECKTIENVIIDSERSSYKEPPREVSYFAYKRLNSVLESVPIQVC